MWKSNLQLTVKVYNINEGRNPEIMEKCEVLAQYSRLVSIIREAARKGELTDVELKRLLQRCIDEGILPDFLQEHGMEAVNMLFEEFTQEEVNEIFARQGYERGHAQGHAESQAAVAVKMLQEGLDIALIMKITDLTEEQVLSLKEEPEVI